MKKIIIGLSLLASTSAFAETPRWHCDGRVDAYHDGWGNTAKFEFSGPTGETNFIETKVNFDGLEANLMFEHNPKGTSGYGDDPRVEENVSTNIAIKSEAFNAAGGNFSAVDGADLPNKMAIRQDFTVKSISYILRLVCSRN